MGVLRQRIGAAVGGREIGGMLVAAAVGKLHVAGLGLAVLLLVEAGTGSLAAAGSAVGALSLGVGATRPIQGRLLDRVGLPVIGWICAAHVAVAAALLVVGPSHGGALIALSLALGLTCPALAVVTRAVIAARVHEPDRARVLGIDTALLDLAFAVGPLLGGAIAAAASPQAAVVVLVAIGCAGSAGAARLAPPVPVDPRARALARPALRPITRPLILSVGQGVVYGALGVAGVAAVLAHGDERLAGPAVAAVFAGGLIGDLLLAPRRARSPLHARLLARTTALLVVVALALAATTVGVLLVALLACGAALAAVGVTVLLDVAARTNDQGRGEAFGWAGAALRLGDAAGAAGAGFVAQASGARAALLVALAGATIAVISAAAHGRRATDTPSRSSRGRAAAATAAALGIGAVAVTALLLADLGDVTGPGRTLLLLGALGCVAAGAAFGRLRVAVVPLAAAVVVAVLAAASPPPGAGPAWAPLVAVVIVLLGGGATLCVAVGALLRRIARGT